MTLILEITAPSGGKSGDPTRRVFGEDGGTIGRAAANTLVLGHNKVSARHASISCRDGVFYIQDTSRNGVSLNSPTNRLARERPYALKAGDRIFIEPYQIDVSVDGGRGRSAPSRLDPFEPDDPFAPDPRSPLGSPVLDGPSEAMAGGEVDPLNLIDPVGRSGSPRRLDPLVPRVDDLMGEHYGPPGSLAESLPEPVGGSGIPTGYDPLAPDEPAVAPRPRPRPAPGPSRIRPREAPVPALAPTPLPMPPLPPVEEIAAPPPPAARGPEPVRRDGAGTADLAAMLAGAGVRDAVVTPELSRTFGEILRVVVSGLMDVLQSRQRIKEEFRMRQTTFRTSDNNPLKFSANVEDALHNLLVKRNAAYLGPVEAFSDAFDDLRHHQLAMLAGIRVAFEAMLTEFDPDRLQEQFDRQLGKSALPLVPAKMRYWDLYRERRRDMVQDPEAAFSRLFGEEFARAYDEQFRKLKQDRRK